MRIFEQVATEIETNDQSPSTQSTPSTKSEWHESQGSPPDSVKCEMGRMVTFSVISDENEKPEMKSIDNGVIALYCVMCKRVMSDEIERPTFCPI